MINEEKKLELLKKEYNELRAIQHKIARQLSMLDVEIVAIERPELLNDKQVINLH